MYSSSVLFSVSFLTKPFWVISMQYITMIPPLAKPCQVSHIDLSAYVLVCGRPGIDKT